MNKLGSVLLWAAVAIVGAISFAALALGRGESVNAVWLVTAALSVYLIAYRFYSKFIAEKVLQLDDSRPTPAVRHNDGLDYVPTNKWVLYGHHFAAIAGAGPLVGPVLAAQMGYLPGTLVDPRRRRDRRRGAGLHRPVRVDAARRQVARRDDQDGARPDPRRAGAGRRAGDHDHHPRRARAGGGEGAHREPVGPVHDRRDDPDRAADGRATCA